MNFVGPSYGFHEMWLAKEWRKNYRLFTFQTQSNLQEIRNYFTQKLRTGGWQFCLNETQLNPSKFKKKLIKNSGIQSRDSS